MFRQADTEETGIVDSSVISSLAGKAFGHNISESELDFIQQKLIHTGQGQIYRIKIFQIIVLSDYIFESNQSITIELDLGMNTVETRVFLSHSLTHVGMLEQTLLCFVIRCKVCFSILL